MTVVVVVHRVSKETVQNYFCHNFVKIPATLIISGTQLAQRICDMDSFSTFLFFPTVLNADAPNCYITLSCCLQ